MIDLARFDVHQVSPVLYRGPQPDVRILQMLAEAGVRLVVNLRSESDQTRDLCERLWLEYRHIPVDDWTTPEPEQVQEFLELLEEPARGPVLVHCLGGVGRTGVFVSCYRIVHGMSAQDALALSDMETPWMGMNHAQREFVREFELLSGC